MDSKPMDAKEMNPNLMNSKEMETDR